MRPGTPHEELPSLGNKKQQKEKLWSGVAPSRLRRNNLRCRNPFCDAHHVLSSICLLPATAVGRPHFAKKARFMNLVFSLPSGRL
jgi:hypothetical protein